MQVQPGIPRFCLARTLSTLLCPPYDELPRPSPEHHVPSSWGGPNHTTLSHLREDTHIKHRTPQSARHIYTAGSCQSFACTAATMSLPTAPSTLSKTPPCLGSTARLRLAAHRATDRKLTQSTSLRPVSPNNARP